MGSTKIYSIEERSCKQLLRTTNQNDLAIARSLWFTWNSGDKIQLTMVTNPTRTNRMRNKSVCGQVPKRVLQAANSLNDHTPNRFAGLGDEEKTPEKDGRTVKMGPRRELQD